MNMRKEVTVRNTIRIPLDKGKVTEALLSTFSHLCDDKEHIALRLGEMNPDVVPLVRLHSECLTGDVFGSKKCDCGPQLDEAMVRIQDHGGFLLYLRQEGRGIGLYNKIDAYELQEKGYDTFEANRALGFPNDVRDFTAAAEMLKALGHKKIKLLTNNPEKASQLSSHGIDVCEIVNTETHFCAENSSYIEAKRTIAHHLLKPVETLYRSAGSHQTPSAAEVW